MSGGSKILITFGVCIFLLFSTGYYSYTKLGEYKVQINNIEQTEAAINLAHNLLINVVNIGRSQDDYLNTSDSSYLNKHNSNLKQINPHYFLLQSLTDDSTQKVLLDSMRQIINNYIIHSEKLIEIAKSGKINKIDEEIILFNEIVEKCDRFVIKQNELLDLEIKTAESQFSTAIAFIIVLIIISILFIITTGYLFFTDYKKKNKYRKLLREQNQEITNLLEFQNLMLNSTDSAIITTTGAGNLIATFNKGAEKMLGYKANEVIGKSNVLIFHDSKEIEKRAEELSKELKIKVNPDINVFYLKPNLWLMEDVNEWTYIRKNGSRLNVELAFSKISDKAKNTIGFLGIAKDITEHKKTRELLVAAKEASDQANELRQSFLANMSHEIRTPLNVIMGFTDLLLKAKLHSKELDYAQTIKSSSENLLGIINDVLDVSKIDSGMIKFESLPISIKGMFDSLKVMLSEKAKAKNLKLKFETEADLPETLLGDPTRLTQIIINLVGNAIKFTKEGKIEVTAKVLNIEKTIYTIEFCVNDTGIGIAPKKLRHIFDRFTQAEEHTTRNFGGSGLGLNIAKQLVELQGGTIAVTSTEGVGSVFSFTLPFKKTSKKYNEESKNPKTVYVGKLSKINILVVEDNLINIKFVMSLFSVYNIHADVAENGKLALEKMKNKQYDLLLMDIEMPEMNGYETTKIIRNEMQSNIPIIAMTAHAMSGEKQKCLGLGMNDYISKPINVDLLFEKMGKAVANKTKKETAPNKKIVNLNFLLQSLSGQKEMVQEFIDLF